MKISGRIGSLDSLVFHVSNDAYDFENGIGNRRIGIEPNCWI